MTRSTLHRTLINSNIKSSNKLDFMVSGGVLMMAVAMPPTTKAII